MKFFTITEIENLSKEQIDQIMKNRSNILVKLAAERLVGRTLEANEMKKNECQYNTHHSFKIVKVEAANKNEDNYIHSICNTINIYTDSKLKMHKFYNNEKLQFSLTQLMNDMFDERSHARWSYKKDQGENYINMEFFMPQKLIMPDFLAFNDYKEKSKRLGQASKDKLKEKLEQQLEENIEQLKNNSFNLYREDSWYVPQDKKELIRFIDEKTKDFDKEALRGVVQKHPNDEKIVLLCLKHCNEEVFEYASQELKSNRAFIEKAVLKHRFINILEFVDEEFKDDESLILKAIKIGGGYIIRAASDRLKNKKDLCLIAVKNQVEAIGVISDDMRNDKDIMMEVINQRGDYFTIYPEVKTDKDLLIKAFSTAFDRQSYTLLDQTSEELRNDKEVALAALKCCKDNYHALGSALKDEIGNNDPIQYLEREQLNKKLINEVPNNKENKKRMKM